MRALPASVVAAIVVATLPRPSLAGLIDSPIPVVGGEKMKVVYTVTGLTADAFGGLETAFFCTSLEKSKIVTVAIETFDFDGFLANDVTADNGVRTIGVGETRTLETNTIDAIDEDETIDGVSLLHGSARILGSSRKLLCTAAVLSATGTPPTFYATLPIFKKTSQKGD